MTSKPPRMIPQSTNPGLILPGKTLPNTSLSALTFSEEEKDDWDSARNADMEYVPGVTYTVTLTASYLR